MSSASNQVRLLTIDDLPLIEHLLQQSEYTRANELALYQRFTLDELPALLKHYPAVGIFNSQPAHGADKSAMALITCPPDRVARPLRGFLLSQDLNTTCAWIGGFGLSWEENHRYIELLDILLKRLEQSLIARGVRYLHYSGNDTQLDWLRTILLMRGFLPYRLLYAYDKVDYRIPTSGNQQVQLRPVKTRDMPTLLAIEEACFEDLWRYDAISFAEIAATHPYFVVAELSGRVVGYQFNAVDGEFGYLVRIAVHPSFNGQGIGARLMAEAIRFFETERVLRIMLNTQENNFHAHRLYEWFGFIRIQQMGFVLRKYL